MRRFSFTKPPKERAQLTEKLWASLEDTTYPEISPEWLEEINRRCKNIDESHADLIPGEQVLREAREFLDRSRSKR